MPNETRAGVDTHWCGWGDGTPEALLLHCTLAHSGAWKGLAPLLGRPALAFDMPGHGRSGPRDPARDMHDQITAIAESFLPDAPVDLIGHSFGGTVALRLALAHPARVRRLVLIEPVYFAALRGTPAFEAHVADNAPFNDALASGDLARAAQLFTAKWGVGADWASLRADQRETLTAQIQLVAAQGASIFEDRPGVLAAGRLEACAVPTLVLQGAQAEPVVDKVCARLAARLPDARSARIPGAGHMAPITHAADVAAEIVPFLDT